jgi:hypothetical protein
VKWTLLALTCDAPAGTATASICTVPVNQSLGPGLVSVLFLVISMTATLRRGCRPSSRMARL